MRDGLRSPSLLFVPQLPCLYFKRSRAKSLSRESESRDARDADERQSLSPFHPFSVALEALVPHLLFAPREPAKLDIKRQTLRFPFHISLCFSSPVSAAAVMDGRGTLALADLPLTVLQTVFLLLPVQSLMRMRLVSRYFKGVVDRVFAEASVVTLTLIYADSDFRPEGIYDNPPCDCHRGLTINIIHESLSCLDPWNFNEAAVHRLFLATRYVIRHVTSLTAIHFACKTCWKTLHETERLTQQQLVQMHRKTLRCIKIFWMDVDGLFLPELRFLNCRYIPGPATLFHLSAPKLRSLFSRHTVIGGFRSSPDNSRAYHSPAVLPRGLRRIETEYGFKLADLLHSPASQSLEVIGEFNFEPESRFTGCFPKLDTLTADVKTEMTDENPDSPDLEDRTCFSDFLDAHAGSLRQLKLTMHDATLLRRPTRMLDQMRILFLDVIVFAANAVTLLDCMRFLRELKIEWLFFQDADSLFHKLARMSCIESVDLTFGSTSVKHRREPQLRDSLLSFLTGDSMTCLRYLRLVSDNDSWTFRHPSCSWLARKGVIVQQIERMIVHHSLQTALLCGRLVLTSVKSAAAAGDSKGVQRRMQIIFTEYVGPTEATEYAGRSSMHRLEERESDEELFCSVCGKSFSPATVAAGC